VRKKREEIIENNVEDLETSESSWIRSAVGVSFLLLAVTVAVVYFLGDYLPFLFSAKTVLKLAFGKCWFVLVVFLATVGMNILSNDNYGFFSFKNFLLLLLLIAFPAFIHHFCVPVGKELFPEMLKSARGGGFVGGLIALLMHKAFEPDVTLIVLTAILFVSIIFLLPYGDIFKAIIWPISLLKQLIFNRNQSDDDLDEILPEDSETDKNDEVCIAKEDDSNEDDNDEEIRPESKDTKIMPSFGPKETVAPVTPKEKNNNDDFLSARSIIANIKNREKQSEKKDEPSAIEQIYGRKEFRVFSDGVRKENILRRIMSRRSEDNVYNQPGVRANLKENPVDIPNWQGEVERKTPVDDVPVKNNDKVRNPSYDDMRQQKVIPLFADKLENEGSLTFEKKENVVIKHYRENEVDDVELNENEDNTGSVLGETKPKLSRIRYKYPKLDLLDKPKHLSSVVYEKDIQKQCEALTRTLSNFNVNAKIVGVTRGPSITRFEITPAPGVKVSSITSLADDIALNLAAGGVRIEAPIPGKPAIGIEVPNIQNDAVFFREIVDAGEVKNNPSPLTIGLGKDISGNVITIDLAKMPHLLIAGSTGSGKSVCINTLISGILYKAHPEEVKLILVDPKVVELSNYNGIPHLLTPVVTDMKKAASALQWARKEMERRYQIFAENRAREISSYNLGARVKLPYIVIIIDELSDLMMAARIDVEDAILALAQKARAAGIHLVLATQRPSVDVITGVIKANIPSRISFAVSSQTDSRTILDMGGAEKLIGKGDMLYYPIGFNKPVRVQGAFISDNELNRITEFIVGQNYASYFVEEVINQDVGMNVGKVPANSASDCNDDIFMDALRLVMDTGQISASMLQRRFRVGYTRAARLIDKLEEMGIVGQSSGSKPRELIIPREELESRYFAE